MEYISWGITVFMLLLAAFWFIGRPILVYWNKIRKQKSNVPIKVFVANGVSVVIPCCNEEGIITKTVESILNQKLDIEKEIILVENNSKDKTYSEILKLEKEHKEVKAETMITPKNGKAISHAINYGVSLAKYPVIFRLDADTKLDGNNVIKRAIKPIINGTAVLTASNVRIDNHKSNLLTRLQSIEYFFSMELDRGSQEAYDGVLCASGAVQAFRKDIFDEVGGYNTSGIMPEDMDMTLRMGQKGRVKMVSNAVSMTDAPKNIKELAKQRHWWFYLGIVCTWKHKSGIGNKKYKGRGLVSLPLKVIQTFQGLIGVMLKFWIILATDFAGTFEAYLDLTILHVSLSLILILVIMPISHNKQGTDQWFMLPIFSIIYQPFLSAVKLYGLFTAVKCLISENKQNENKVRKSQNFPA